MPGSPIVSQAQQDAFEQVEDDFNDMLDQSLDPRGPDMLYDLVAELGLAPGASAVDVGFGSARHTLELARRFGLNVLAVDPAQRHVDAATDALAREVAESVGSDRTSTVSFALGSAEDLPCASASIDLVWCRDVLCMVEDLEAAYREFRRVLRPGGRALVYQMFATERLEPREAAWLLPTMSCVAASMQPERAEAAMQAAGLRIDSCLILGTEWGEYGQERTGKGARKLLHAARLLRDPGRYIERFGQANYDIALGDALWHVYRLIGKLSDRVYLLSAPAD